MTHDEPTNYDDLPELPGEDTHPNRLIVTGEPFSEEEIRRFWQGVFTGESSVYDASRAMRGELGDRLYAHVQELIDAGLGLGFVAVTRLVTRADPDGDGYSVEDLYTAGHNGVVHLGPLSHFELLDKLIRGELGGLRTLTVPVDSNEGVIAMGLLSGHASSN